ncbi:Nramp family divalent metal transporter [Rossellomorea sp. KS-H15a]|uniref:Nramp family divalent metal transporter n=1 Tax=Rossellomorea sp. KS-H15a TaxID=2963940 RepID=UPI0020C6F075|nr:Nramp family divalent metal transporter [Rossellomorea sp. KS-H15a]UTE77433.1 Nramp family divalent metal transporter [Rossellomorea sp. KS-H15a]
MDPEVNRSAAETPQEVEKKRSILSQLGPALITSALVLGPGSLTLSSKIGAIYGMQLIWILIIVVFFMMMFTEMSTRIGLAAKESFIQIMKKKWGRFASVLIGIGAFLVTGAFQAGNALGSGLAVSTVTGYSPTLWIAVVTILGMGIVFAKNFYKILEKLMLGLVLVMLVSFFITLVLTKPSISSILSGFVPVIPDGSLPLIIALTATSFSIVGAVYQSYLVQEKGWNLQQQNQSSIKETYLGIFILGFITMMIMICAAVILKPKGIVVNSVSEMGLALEPLYGNGATILFMVGLFGASFSSQVGNATIGGTMIADGLGLGSTLSSKAVRGFILLVMLFGSSIAMIFGAAPINLIIFAQAITIVIVPIIAVAILVVANDEKIMGSLKNTLWKNIVGFAGLVVLILLAVNNIVNIFIK